MIIYRTYFYTNIFARASEKFCVKNFLEYHILNVSGNLVMFLKEYAIFQRHI